MPFYYDNKEKGFNPDWLAKMKVSLALISNNYNSDRMAEDYFTKAYQPIVTHYEKLIADDNAKLKELVKWESDIRERFNTVKIKTILVNGVKDGKITSGGLVKFKLLLFSGKLYASELRAELALVKSDGRMFISTPIIIPLKLIDGRESGVLTYEAEYNVEDPGFYAYGIRVLPSNPLLLHPQDIGVVYWG